MIYVCVCVTGSDEELPLKRHGEPSACLCVFWLAGGEANVTRHLAGPKVTLVVTDQSGLAE